MRVARAVAFAAAACGAASAEVREAAATRGTEANPPLWPKSVHVFDPGEKHVAQTAARLSALGSALGRVRAAFLFKPGTYAEPVAVGPYVQVLGLGAAPEDVALAGGVAVVGGDDGAPRGAENVHVPGDLAFAGGGLRAVAGGARSWLARNVAFDAAAAVDVDATRRATRRPSSRRPDVTIRADGTYDLRVPAPRFNASGPDHSEDPAVDFGAVFVATDAVDSDVIQEKLDRGLHVVLAPGYYDLEDGLVLSLRGQVLLGLGHATLAAPPGGLPAVQVLPGAHGARVAGVVVDATAAPRGETALRPRRRRSRRGVARGDGADAAGERAVAGGCGLRVGIVVVGHGAAFYGLAVEHAGTDGVRWLGENGTALHAEAILPFDGTQGSFGNGGHSGFAVGDFVKAHDALAVAVYGNFRDEAVVVRTAVRKSASPNATFEGATAAHLGGLGTIAAVINGDGAAVGPAGNKVSRWP
ncbi:hypothetical protein JL720_6523 [Aureococcus anophagefferens]|nr:hypothetical protein JL720_6523 [Aureococcus anophagefferens]